jgi:hypothetical protein
MRAVTKMLTATAGAAISASGVRTVDRGVFQTVLSLAAVGPATGMGRVRMVDGALHFVGVGL